MKLTLYNTLWRELQEFIPIDKNNIKIYSCGPTVYSEPHIGNIRYFVFCGLLRKTLEDIMDYKVTHVMNITDVGHLVSDGDEGEDKMEKGARREGITARDVAERYTQTFMNILEKLNIQFDILPKATDHITEQIDMIQVLEQKGYTYVIENDGVYFDTKKMPDYGVLVGKKHLEGLQSWSRVEDAGKRNLTDFALWKFNISWKKRDMERGSPRGIGFPGWHIECSAMGTKYLGKHFDIHTGGIDHIAVHHTNEIAQSECSTCDKPRVNYRLHSQFLNSNWQKISKSLENGYTLGQILEKWYQSEDLVYFFYQAHYRSFQDFTWEGLEAAKKGRKGLKLVEDEGYPYDDVIAPLLQDLNTPVFLANLHKHGVSTRLNSIFNLVSNEEWAEVIIVPADVQNLADQRRQAKFEKNWELADSLRTKIEAKWFKMLDQSDSFQIIKI